MRKHSLHSLHFSLSSIHHNLPDDLYFHPFAFELMSFSPYFTLNYMTSAMASTASTASMTSIASSFPLTSLGISHNWCQKCFHAWEVVIGRLWDGKCLNEGDNFFFVKVQSDTEVFSRHLFPFPNQKEKRCLKNISAPAS